MSAKEKKIQIVLFFVVSTLFFVVITAYQSYITPLCQDLGLGPAQIGAILGTTGIASMLSRFPIGVLSQMFAKRRMVIQIGLLLSIIPWAIAFYAPSYWTLWIAKAASGLTGATWVMYTVLFSTYFTKEEIPKSISVINLASSIGPVVGITIGGYFAAIFDYRYALMVAVVGGIIAFFLIFLLKEPDKTPASTPAQAWEIGKSQFTDGNVWKIGLMATIPMMATYAFMDYLTPVIITNLGGGAVQLAISSNCFRISSIVASPLVGYFFYKQVGARLTIFAGAVGLGLSCILMPWSPGFMGIYVLHCGIGFFFTMNFTMLLAMIIMGVPSEHQTTRMGLLQSIYSVGLAFGPMLAGVMTESMSTKQCSLVMGGVVIALALFTRVLMPMFIVNKPTKKDSTGTTVTEPQSV